jgi:hypothetical protein
MSAQPPAGPPRLAAARVRRSRSAPVPLAFNLLARGLLPCTRTRLQNRAEPATGRTLPLAPADAPVQFRPDLWVLQLRRPLHLLRRHVGRGLAAPGHLLCLTSPPPLARRGGDPGAAASGPRGRRFGRCCCLFTREGVLDAMLLADKLLPNPPLLLLCSRARASAARTSAPCSSRLPLEQSSPRPSAPCYSSWRAAPARPRSYSFSSCCRTRGPSFPRSPRPCRAAVPPAHAGLRATTGRPRGRKPWALPPLARGRSAPGAAAPTQARRTARIHAGLKRAEGGRQGKTPRKRRRRWGKRKDAKERENREEGEMEFSQGLVRKFRKL